MIPSSTGSRTDVILATLRREILDRRTAIDAADDIAEIRLTIRLRAGTAWVERTQYSEERIMRARLQRATGSA